MNSELAKKPTLTTKSWLGKLAAQYRLPAIYQGWQSYVA